MISKQVCMLCIITGRMMSSEVSVTDNVGCHYFTFSSQKGNVEPLSFVEGLKVQHNLGARGWKNRTYLAFSL